jgi:cell division protein ZapA
MTDTPHSRVSVRILEKEYQFACAVDERAALLDSAEYLNGEMKKIRDSGKVIGLDRIAVMAALNMANELLKNRSRDTSLEGDVVHRVRLLRERVEATLERGQQLEL